MERPTSRADLEPDDDPPREQLSDEMFVFQDGRWVTETCRLPSPRVSPPSSFHRRLRHARPAREALLQEENRALRAENRALRAENRLLRLGWEEREAALGGRDDDDDNDGGRALRLLCAENRALRRRLEQGQAEGGAAAAPPREEPHDRTAGRASPAEERQAPPSPQEDRAAPRALRGMVSALAAAPGDDDGDGDGDEAGKAGASQAPGLLRALRREPRPGPGDEARWEKDRLELQQKLVVDMVTEVTARMAMLVEELYALVPARSQALQKPSRV